MEIRFNVTGPARKELVKVISEVIGTKAVYQFMPTCAFTIGDLTVTKDGALVSDERTDLESLRKVLTALETAGFAPESLPAEFAESQPEPQMDVESGDSEAEQAVEPVESQIEPQTTEDSTDSEAAQAADSEEPIGLMVSVPREGFSDAALDNLRKLVNSKRSLIMKALDADDLPILVNEEEVSFPWFQVTDDADTNQAYFHLVTKLCAMAKEAKRVTATEKAVDNEKYAFRCFLLRLGFIGSEYKVYRKILMKNLNGNAAFKSGHRREEAVSNDVPA